MNHSLTLSQDSGYQMTTNWHLSSSFKKKERFLMGADLKGLLLWAHGNCWRSVPLPLYFEFFVIRTWFDQFLGTHTHVRHVYIISRDLTILGRITFFRGPKHLAWHSSNKPKVFKAFSNSPKYSSNIPKVFLSTFKQRKIMKLSFLDVPTF